ncbi:MAG: PBSX family phage terminase large subunit [Bacteroidales bacterium]|nr:PBSX family phage terminase large subunit [Bacteroidales bacterium]
MMMETRQIDLNSKYQPLLTSKSRYIVVAGGRGSGKSFAITTALCYKAMSLQNVTILFTRYTLTNARTSIIPEFVDKITRLGWDEYFYVHPSENQIICLATGTKILFRGLKTASGINTAALKSIPNLALWVNDESEELVDGNLFDTIDLSIRSNDTTCQVWLVLNPSDIQHFIYRRFFAENGIGDVTNESRGNITYIHTTYKDNMRHLPAEYIALAEKAKEIDLNFYNNIWLGRWAKMSEGLIYRDWQQITDADYPTTLPCWYGVDWGFSNDPAAVVRICFNPITYTLYIKELLYERGLLTGDIARVIHNDIATRKRDYILTNGNKITWDGKGFIGEMSDNEECRRIRRAIENREGEVYCDPARPEQIREMKINHYLNAMGAVNTDKVGRIEYLKYFNVCYVGDNIHAERTTYRWQTSKTDKSQYINVPQDGNDHLMDAINYGSCTHLRRLGIANRLGER